MSKSASGCINQPVLMETLVLAKSGFKKRLATAREDFVQSMLAKQFRSLIPFAKRYTLTREQVEERFGSLYDEYGHHRLCSYQDTIDRLDGLARTFGSSKISDIRLDERDLRILAPYLDHKLDNGDIPV